ncbi:MAG: AAA family ATPase [Acidobacteriota bacterium]
MSKIKQIRFKNYRAFWSEGSPIDIDGKNTLIYGENGSGKSSIYSGLRDFFSASDVNWTIDPSPIHIKAGDGDYKVEVVFENPSKTLSFDGQTINDPLSSQTFLLNSFVSYREMLRTHFLEKGVAFEEMLFTLLIDTLLAKHELGATTVSNAFQDLKRDVLETVDKSESLRRLKESRPDAEEDDLDEVDSEAELDKFKSGFDQALKEISLPLNAILAYFDQGISVEFDDLSLSLGQESLKGALGLNVKYIQTDHVAHLEILNEARLSALALSIFLASIVTNPIAQTAPYKILFLDDVFTGLDMSNRLPLLRILEEFSLEDKNPFFNDFQIFLTTYDRYWYEIAKKRLTSWSQVELFVGDEKDAAGNKRFEKPVVIQKNLSNIERAKRFMASFDYFSTGNSLRKALEEELERLVPNTYRINVDKLETFIDKLFLYYEECACDDLIPAGLKFQLKTFKESVLNPSSHYDLKSPLYRAEIEETFRIIDQVKQLPLIARTLLIGMRSPIFYKNDASNYMAEYMLRENLYKVAIAGYDTRFTDPNSSLIRWTIGGIEFSKPDGTVCQQAEIDDMRLRVNKLSERPARIQNFLALATPPIWQEFLNAEGKTLTNLAAEE